MTRLPRSAESPAGPLGEIVEAFTLGPFATNCYLVRAPGHGGCWVVDASWGAAAMTDRARALGLTPELVVLTHAHVDHIAGLDEVRSACPGVPVLLHSAEHGWLGDPALNLSAALEDAPVSMPPADGTLEDGQELTLGTHVWRVLHTPGHSPGGVSLYAPEIGVVLAGDTLFAGSIGRFDFPTSDEDALFASIREKLYALPDETVVLPGHGPATTIGAEKRSNPYVRPRA